MKSIRLATARLILFAALYIISCNKGDSSSGGGGDDFFVSDISAAAWANKADANNTFFFLPDSVKVNHSLFTGNENLSSGGQDHFTGSFTNHQITFTYDAGSSNNKAGKAYSGTINDASTEITLSSTTLGSLILDKH